MSQENSPDFFLRLFQKHAHKDYEGITTEDVFNAVAQIEKESKMLSYQQARIIERIETLQGILNILKGMK